jgi:hypothetical protein
MMDAPRRRTLIVANRTAATPLLLEEVTRRARERPTTFALLVPDVESKQHADWTLAEAVPLLERAARDEVQTLVGGSDPLTSIERALAGQAFDDVLISTLSKRTSVWLRRDLPSKVRRLGVPVAVVTAEKERAVPAFAGMAPPPG